MRVVSFVSGLKGSTYDEKLKELNLQTLKDRKKEQPWFKLFRLSIDLTMLTRIAGLNLLVWEINWDTRLNQECLILAKPVARLEIRKHFFSHRVIDLWNSLPHDVKHKKIHWSLKNCKIKTIESGGWNEKNWSFINLIYGRPHMKKSRYSQHS